MCRHKPASGGGAAGEGAVRARAVAAKRPASRPTGTLMASIVRTRGSEARSRGGGGGGGGRRGGGRKEGNGIVGAEPAARTRLVSEGARGCAAVAGGERENVQIGGQHATGCSRAGPTDSGPARARSTDPDLDWAPVEWMLAHSFSCCSELSQSGLAWPWKPQAAARTFTHTHAEVRAPSVHVEWRPARVAGLHPAQPVGRGRCDQ